MSRKHKRRDDRQAKTVKKTTLVVALIVIFAFSLVLGITGFAMGFGSIYPQLNLIAQPIACPGQTMTHSQQISEDRYRNLLRSEMVLR